MGLRSANRIILINISLSSRCIHDLLFKHQTITTYTAHKYRLHLKKLQFCICNTKELLACIIVLNKKMSMYNCF